MYVYTDWQHATDLTKRYYNKILATEKGNLCLTV